MNLSDNMYKSNVLVVFACSLLTICQKCWQWVVIPLLFSGCFCFLLSPLSLSFFSVLCLVILFNLTLSLKSYFMRCFFPSDHCRSWMWRETAGYRRYKLTWPLGSLPFFIFHPLPFLTLLLLVSFVLSNLISINVNVCSVVASMF